MWDSKRSKTNDAIVRAAPMIEPRKKVNKIGMNVTVEQPNELKPAASDDDVGF